MSRKRRSNGSLLGTLLLLVLIVVFIFPQLFQTNYGGGTAPGTGGGVTTPGENETPAPDTGGGTTTPGEGESGGGTDTGDEITTTLDKLALATGKIDEYGNCTHSRYTFSQGEWKNEVTCYYTATCQRCGEFSRSNYFFHHFKDGACTLCDAVCTHTNDGAGYCNFACGKDCEHIYIPGTLDTSDTRNLFFYNVNEDGVFTTVRENAARVCSRCGHSCFHESVTEGYTYVNANYCRYDERCNDCGYVFASCLVGHNYNGTTCTLCGGTCNHVFEDKICTACGFYCNHSSATVTYTIYANAHDTVRTCNACGFVSKTNAPHVFDGAKCTVCQYECIHTFVDGICKFCGTVCTHTFTEGTCSTCGTVCDHALTYQYYPRDNDVYTVKQSCICGQENATLTNEYFEQYIQRYDTATSADKPFTFIGGMTWEQFLDWQERGTYEGTTGGSFSIYNSGPDDYWILLDDCDLMLNGERVRLGDYIQIDGVYGYGEYSGG